MHPDATPPAGNIYLFSKMTVTLKQLCNFMPFRIKNGLYYIVYYMTGRAISNHLGVAVP